MNQKGVASCTVVIALCTFLSTIAHAQNDQLSVVVLDEDNRGVASTVFARSALQIDLRLRDTESDGHLNIKYDCQMGYTLWAQPKDSVKYFQSEATDCQADVRLLVISKQSPLGPIEDIFSKTINSATEPTHIVVSKLILTADAQAGQPITNDPLLPPSNRQDCTVDFKPLIVTAVFTQTADGRFDKTDEIRSSPANDENLTVERSTYNAPCNQAYEMIAKSKADWVRSTRAYLSNIYNAPLSAETYQMYHSPGVEFRTLLEKYLNNPS